MKNNDVITAIKMSSKDKEELNVISQSKGITLSGLIRMILKDYLKKEVTDAK